MVKSEGSPKYVYRPYQCTNRYTCTLGTRIFSPYSFLFQIRTEQPCFYWVKIKGSEILKVLSDSISKNHGIEMVGNVNWVHGIMGYITNSTQIPRNHENGRCHS